MKIFLYKSVFFLAIVLILFHVKPFYLLINEKYKKIVAGREVYYCLEKSKNKSKNKSKKLLMGDSVGNQLFSCTIDNDTINSLACNQTISMVGQYILLDRYLKAGNQVDTVFFLFTPTSLKNNLDQIYTFHYFLKPFYKEEFFSYFSVNVYNQLSKISFKELAHYPPILTSNWAPDFNTSDNVNYTFLSPISVEYIKKIKELAKAYTFKLLVLPTPVSAYGKKQIEMMNKKEICYHQLENELDQYFENILYLPDSLFSDAIHLKDPYPYTVYYKKKYLRIKS